MQKMITKQLPFTEPEWKIPGYTGYIQGLQETYRKTPVMSQLEIKQPTEDSFIHTRTCTVHKPTPARDPCNYPENFRKAEPGNLWPRLQDKAIQDTAKPPRSFIELGDARIDPFKTSYNLDFNSPFQSQSRIRSPMRNKDLENTETALHEHYLSAYNRVGEGRLKKMIATMRERLSAKLGNSNNNAFKMRRLFKMYDKEHTGLIHFEDFRMMGESFGMQLDDDSLLALYHMYDKEGSGYLGYEQLMAELLDSDYYSMYIGNVDNTQGRVESEATLRMTCGLRERLAASKEEMVKVFATFDDAGSGSISRKDFLSACAVLGVVLSDKEQDHILGNAPKGQGASSINYVEFCRDFASH